MGGLAHYLEDEGIPTVGISLIRTHTEKMKPPRALAVPFELGRPFGPPNEPDFQRRVLAMALGLFEGSRSPPVLEDFPDEPPGSDAHSEGWACPVSFAEPVEDLSDADLIERALTREIALLRPWYDEAARNFRRSAFGISGKSADEIAHVIAAYVTDPDGSPDPIAGERKLVGLKRCIDDLRYFYCEAAIARPDARTSDLAVANWLWGETTLGKMIIAIRDHLMDEAEASGNAGLKRLATTAFVPSHQRFRTKHG